MDGGTGDDILTGGRGVDVFIFGSSDGADTITDFRDRGKDMLKFVDTQAKAFSDDMVSIVDGNAVVTVDDTVITLQGVTKVNASWFDFDAA